MEILIFVASQVSRDDSDTLLPIAEKSMRREVETLIESVKRYGITPCGDTHFNEREHCSFVGDNIHLIGRQKVEGDWLSFLHARRNGLIPKLKLNKFETINN